MLEDSSRGNLGFFGFLGRDYKLVAAFLISQFHWKVSQYLPLGCYLEYRSTYLWVCIWSIVVPTSGLLSGVS